MDTRSSAPLASYIDLLLDAVCAVDGQGRFVFVSAACEQIFGYTPQELIGQPMIDLVHPADRQRTLEAAREIMDGEPKLNFENRYLRKDGRVVHILWSARWSPVDQLRIAVARDITERKQAESRQAALYAISEAAHAAADLLALFKRIHLIIGEWLPALNFSVALYDEQCSQLNFPYHVDDREGQPELPGTVTGRLCAEVIRSGQPILLTPGCNDLPPGFDDLVARPDAPCWLGVPLNSQSGTIGALIVKSAPHNERYTEQDKELLQYVCAQITVAIERKQLHARLQHMAQYDQLTQVPNRELLRERFKCALASARGVRAHGLAVHRPGPFQADQRHLWPRGWRHAVTSGGQSSQGLYPRHRHRGTYWRGRVRGAAAQHPGLGGCPTRAGKNPPCTGPAAASGRALPEHRTEHRRGLFPRPWH